MEQWKSIPGYDGYYEASNQGRIRSVNRTIILKDRNGLDRLSIFKGKVLKSYLKTYKRSNISPRLQVALSIKGKVKTLDVHKLIALTFIPNLQNKETINHKDGNTLNNNADNLEWVSKKENNRHGFINGLIKTQKPIAQLNPNTMKVLRVYPGESEACRRMNVSQGKIRRAIQSGWKLHGFYWDYAANQESVTTIEPWLGR